VDVAFDGGEDDLASGGCIGLFHELFEVGDAGFHGFGRLKYFCNNQLVVVEKTANFGHAGHEGTVDDVERVGAFGAFAIEIFDETVFRALDDVGGQAFVEREVGRFGFDLGRGFAEVIGDGGDVELVDGGALFFGLLAPVVGHILDEFELGVIGRNVHRRGVKRQGFG